MPTLFIGAPYKKGPPGAANSFETYLVTGVGKRYAIWAKWAPKIKPGWNVVLLRNDKDKKRAEGILIDLPSTGTSVKGVQQFDVHMSSLKQVTYRKPPTKLNPFGVLVTDS